MKKNIRSGNAAASNLTLTNRVRNAALAAILAAGIVGAPYVTATSAYADDSDSGDDSNQIKKKSDSASMFKDETVYVFKKADGATKNITVSDWLKNGDKNQTLNDVSNLTGVVNTEGSQAFTTGKKNKLTWAAGGDDIYYQGSSDAKLPVDVKATYWLDGKKVTPEEISGKSGEVKIRYDYTNKSKVTKNGVTVYTPFVAMTAVVLDNENFSNVRVKNAKTVNDGERIAVVGYALPGLAESLDVNAKDLDIPEYVEIKADAKDFTLDTSATYLTSNLFDDVDTGDLDVNTIGDKLNDMQSAMEQLMDGSNTLLDGMEQLTNGSQKLATGLKAAKTGTKQLADGSGSVLDGLNQMKNGTSTSVGLAYAAASIGTTKDTQKDGTLLGGVNALSSGVASAKGGGAQLEAGLKQMKSELNAGLGSASDTTTNTLMGGANLIAAGAGELESELSAKLKPTIADAGSKVSNAANGLSQYLGGASQAIAGSSQSIGTAQTALDKIGSGTDVDNSTAVADLKNAIANDDTLDEAAKNNLSALADATAVNQTATDNAAAVAEAKGALAEAKAKNTGAQSAIGTSADTGTGSAFGLTNLLATAGAGLSAAAADGGKIDEAITGAQKLKAGATNLKAGLQQLGTKANTALGDEKTNNTLIYGAHAINGGFDQVADGLKQLSDGLKVMRFGGTVQDGKTTKTTEGLDGAVKALGTENTKNTLIYGAAAVNGGLGTLLAASGTAVEGAETIAVNMAKATKGTAELSDGLQQFDEQAVQKLLDVYNDNLGGLTDRVDALVDAGKDYNNYSGISKDMEGQVKFVIEMDGINDDDSTDGSATDNQDNDGSKATNEQ